MLSYLFIYAFVIFVLVVLFWQVSLLVALIFGAPTVYSKEKTIESAFEMAGLKKNQLVLDLGCGNARSLIIASKKFNAKGVGVEVSPFYFILAKINVFWSGESKNIKIKFGNLKSRPRDIQNADLIFLYLFDKIISEIEPWIFKAAKKHAKIISLAFPFKNHKTASSNMNPSIYIYEN